MKHLRSDYDAIQPWPTKRPHIVKIDGAVVDVTEVQTEYLGKRMDPLIPADEPVFLLRAMDPAGAPTVLIWAEIAEANGADPALCKRVRDWADEMMRYKLQHEDAVHAPDVPPGRLRP